jgi:hypothetical protein
MFVIPFDESCLLAAIVVILILYWVPPRPKENYLYWVMTRTVIVIGAYVALFKAPWLLTSIISYRLGGFLCLAAYLICFWVLARKKRKSVQNPERSR